MSLTDRWCWGVTRPGDLVALCGSSNHQNGIPTTKTACTKTKIYTIQDIFLPTITPASMGYLPTRSKRQRKQADGLRALRFTIHPDQTRQIIPIHTSSRAKARNEILPRHKKTTTSTTTTNHVQIYSTKEAQRQAPLHRLFSTTSSSSTEGQQGDHLPPPSHQTPHLYNKSCYTRSKLHINRQSALSFNKLRINRQSALGFYRSEPQPEQQATTAH
jgi:hypothetical protein